MPFVISIHIPNRSCDFDRSKYIKTFTWMFWGPWGMGRLEGAQGSRSRGDPHRKEELFSSPRLFQTRELGQRRVMIWRVAHRLSTIPRCWGQLLYWANTVDRGFWVIIWLLVMLDKTRWYSIVSEVTDYTLYIQV